MRLKRDSNAFITKFGYLSVPKQYLNSTDDSHLVVEGVEYCVNTLKHNITYFDNKDYYRWNRRDFNKAIMKGQ